MNSSSVPDPEELFSAEFDSGATNPSTAGIDADRANSLLTSWQQIGDSLRAMPVGDGNRLHLAVLKEIRSEIESSQRAGQALVASDSRASRQSQWAALLVSVAAVLLVCISWMDNPGTSETIAATSLKRLGAEVASLPEDWEVLVVTLADGSVSGIPESFRRTAGDRGLQLHSLTDAMTDGKDHPQVLMASGDLSSEVRGVLESDQGGLQIEMNPDQIGELSRAELLNKFAESMKTPTKSDEYFGEMFVVLADDDDVVVKSIPTGSTLKEVMVADAANANDRSITDVAVTDSQPAGSDNVELAVRNRLSTNGGKPVLVVFVKRKPAPTNDRSEIRMVPRDTAPV